MSTQTAIHLFCKSCIFDAGQVGSWKAQAHCCASTSCALYKYRPLSTAGGLADRLRKLDPNHPLLTGSPALVGSLRT